MTARSFWPAAEAAQVDYETLRVQVLTDGSVPDGLTATRFARRGLAGLIAWPAAEPVYLGEVFGATRPAWQPHLDPRVTTLAASYQFLLDAAVALGDAMPSTIGGQR